MGLFSIVPSNGIVRIVNFLRMGTIKNQPYNRLFPVPILHGLGANSKQRQCSQSHI